MVISLVPVLCKTGKFLFGRKTAIPTPWMLCSTLLSATLATLHIVINIRRAFIISKPKFAEVYFAEVLFAEVNSFKVPHTNDNDHKICYTASIFTNFLFKNIRKRRITTLLY